MKFQLPDELYSPQDLAGVIVELKTYTHWLRQQTVRQRVGARAKTMSAPELTPAATAVLRSGQAQKSLTAASLEQLIAQLQQLQRRAPLVAITLAAPAPHSL